MDKEIEISRDGAAGIIKLTRPKAINALSPAMISTIGKTLSEWADDDDVKLVLLEGEGSRGFCAGGDVRSVIKSVVNGRTEEALDFFVAEYGVNKQIATYAKPIVALTHGVVMGGGIGLAGHAGFRFTTAQSRFAMPEGAIGFFADVGVQSILASVPRHQALMFMLTGDAVNAADAKELNLTDAIIAPESFAEIRQQILATAKAGDVAAALNNLLGEEQENAEAADLCALADLHATCFASNDCIEIVANLVRAAQRSAELRRLVDLIKSRCPTSLWVHVLARTAAEANGSIGVVLANDLRLAHMMALRGDFAEGVRALLIDKDQNPHWQPTNLEDVDRRAISQALGQ